ncbi:MAG: CotH kinase family protein [Bacteroidales bacterium]|nr:CotH kinase family protein [Bacteroidales bacterium]MCF8454369.1 CotH kinase family protein [Bacteroidales bacterium]
MRTKYTILFVVFLSLTNLCPLTAQIDHWEMVVQASDNWRYFPGTQEPDVLWKELSFNDNSWDQGPGGIGYGDGDDATVIAPVISVYIRRIFSVTNSSDLLGGLFYIDYDDAFVAYLNGVEIARGNIGTPGIIPTFDTNADNYNHEAQMYQGGQPESFVLSSTAIDSLIVSGNNVLAIQVHNFGVTSSDLSAIPFLFVATSSATTNGPQLPVWFDENDFGFSTHLPILAINTNNQQIVDDPRIVADLKIFQKPNGQPNSLQDMPNGYDGKISIEIRGNSSQMFDKKSFSFETQLPNGDNNNVSLLGLPEENDWVLYGPYSDKSLVRNVLVYELARQMGWYASRTVFCELFINNDYWGLYVLMEKIKQDKNRVDIDKLDADDNYGDSVTGGYIIKVDWPDDGSNYDWHSPVTNFNGTFLNLNYQYRYPERDDITVQQGNYIKNSVTYFEQALIGGNYTDIQTGYRAYIDVHSFADNFILNELTFNIDAYRLSNYYTRVRNSNGGRLFAGPVWDFNLGFGNADYGNGWVTYGWALDNPGVTSVIPFHQKRLRQDPDFQEMLKCRWNTLRSSVLSQANIYSIIDSLVTYLGPAIDRNFNRWNIIGVYVWPNYYVGNTYSEEVTYLKDYIEDRLDWIDSNLPGYGNYCQSFYRNKIIVSEINYKAGTAIDPGDWFEIYNKSTTAFDLSGWVIKDENNLNTFTLPYETNLGAGDYLVICSNKDKFITTFPWLTNCVGSFNWKLGNNDHLRMYDEDGFIVSEINYKEDNPWPELSSQQDETLELLDPLLVQNNPGSWFAGCPGGSPGGPYLTPCPPLRIDDLDVADFSVFPNPVEDQLTVLFPSQTYGRYELIAVDGKVVLSGKVDETELQISTRELEAGYYVLKVLSENSSWTKSIVKSSF